MTAPSALPAIAVRDTTMVPWRLNPRKAKVPPTAVSESSRTRLRWRKALRWLTRPPVASYIHGETDAKEIERLEKQARFLTRWILDGVEAGPGARVLDLACGTGAMMRRLMARLPD